MQKKRDSKYGGRAKRRVVQTRVPIWQGKEILRLVKVWDVTMSDIVRYSLASFLCKYKRPLTRKMLINIEYQLDKKYLIKRPRAKSSKTL